MIHSSVGRRHGSVTKNIHSDKTLRGSKVFFGYCSICNRIQSMTVSDNIILAEGLGNSFKNIGKKTSKMMATSVMKKTSRALETSAFIAGAAASLNTKAALSTTPDAIHFYHTGECSYLCKYV